MLNRIYFISKLIFIIKVRKLTNILLLIDVDGVLTDGKFIYSEKGKILKTFGAEDSDILNLIKYKIKIKFITADKRGFRISQKRVNDMGFSLNYCLSKNRESLIKKFQKKDFCVIFVADSFTDLNGLNQSNISVVPKNGSIFIKKKVDLILKNKGGEGAVAELGMLLFKCLN